MLFFVDIVNIDEIKEVNELGIFVGVMMNFSLVVKEVNVLFYDCFCEIIDVVKGFVSVEVIFLKVEEMIEEGKELVKIVLNIMVKILMMFDGLKVVRVFIDLGIKINVILIFNVNQVFFVVRVGVMYVFLFLGCLDDIGYNGFDLILDVKMIFDIYGFDM